MTAQKFPKLSFVRIADELPSYMKHFECRMDAIVQYSYAEEYGGSDVNSYSLYLLKDGKIINTSAWYEEDQLTLLDNPPHEAEMMIEKYKKRNV